MIWKPKKSVCVRLFQADRRRRDRLALDETITCEAARTEPMPSVAMNELTPSLTTMNELTQPITTARAMPAAIAGTTAQWWLFSRTT